MAIFANKAQSTYIGELKEAFEENDLTFKVDLFVWSEIPEEFKLNILFYKTKVQTISNSWQTVKLGDVCDFGNDKISIKEVSKYNYISTENLLPNKAGKQDASSLPNVKQLTKIVESQVVV